MSNRNDGRNANWNRNQQNRQGRQGDDRRPREQYNQGGRQPGQGEYSGQQQGPGGRGYRQPGRQDDRETYHQPDYRQQGQGPPRRDFDQRRGDQGYQAGHGRPQGEGYGGGGRRYDQSGQQHQGYNRPQAGNQGRGRGSYGRPQENQPEPKKTKVRERALDKICQACKQHKILSYQSGDNLRDKGPFTYLVDAFSVAQVCDSSRPVTMIKSAVDDHCDTLKDRYLMTNYFVVKGINVGTVQAYDISFKGDRPAPKKQRPGVAAATQSMEQLLLGAEAESDRSAQGDVPVPGDAEDADTPSLGKDPKNLSTEMELKKEEKREIMDTFIKMVLDEFQVKDCRAFAFDGGKIMFCCQGVIVKHCSRVVKFKRMHITVACQHTGTVSIPPQLCSRGSRSSGRLGSDGISTETLQCFDVMLRHAMCRRFTCYGRSYFDLSDTINQISLNKLTSLHKGFFSNFRCFFDKIAINLDVANGVFRNPCFLTDYLERAGYKPDELLYRSKGEFEDASKLVRGLKIMVSHSGYKRYMKAESLVYEDARTHTFKEDKNDDIVTTVADYFRRRYNISCREYLPIVKTTKGSIPMELCYVPCTRITDCDQDNIKQEMIKHTALPPSQRSKAIMDKFAAALRPDDEYLSYWGMSFECNMSTVKYGILRRPALYVQDQTEIKDFNSRTGVYNFNCSYFMPPIERRNGYIATALSLASLNQNNVKSFVQGICEECNMAGMDIKYSNSVCESNDRELVRALNEILYSYGQNNSKVDLIFVVMPAIAGSDCYAYVKSVCELQYGVISQCVKENTIFKCRGNPNNQLRANFAHKLNAKLGGVNVSLTRGLNPTPRFDPLNGQLGYTMLVGVDVTHGGASSRLSVVAVVGSLDHFPHMYDLQISGQKHPKSTRQSIETVVDMKNIMVRLLQNYVKHNKRPPQRVIVYRDGVSEGQFNVVLNYEFVAIKRAITEVCKQTSPDASGNIQEATVTYCVVQKRHHTRFFGCQGQSDNLTRNGNTIPGTVVDAGVCKQTEFDFFLCSHEGIQGTSRPTYYRVLVDENKLSRRSIEQLTYSLCFTFARCTRSVSLPAPCYYAHLAAFRARHYVDVFGRTDDAFMKFVSDPEPEKSSGQAETSTKRPSSSSETELSIVSITVKPDIAKTLFFV